MYSRHPDFFQRLYRSRVSVVSVTGSCFYARLTPTSGMGSAFSHALPSPRSWILSVTSSPPTSSPRCFLLSRSHSFLPPFPLDLLVPLLPFSLCFPAPLPFRHPGSSLPFRLSPLWDLQTSAYVFLLRRSSFSGALNTLSLAAKNLLRRSFYATPHIFS